MTISFRPQTARAVASRAPSLAQFGLNLRDWLHHLRTLSTKAALSAAVSHRPPRLRAKFADGEIADAFLAAQVEYLCHHAGLRPPSWVNAADYVLDTPWFGSTVADKSSLLRALLIRDAAPEFASRNLFTTSELTWKPRRGRPPKSYVEKLEVNRLRQQRWRQRLRLTRPSESA